MIQGAKKISQLQTLTVNGSEIVPVVQDDGLGNLTTGTLPITDFGSDTNIYNTDGTLTGNRVVNMGGNNLQFDNGQVSIGNTIGSTYLMEINGTGEAKRGLNVESSGLTAINATDLNNIAILTTTQFGFALSARSIGSGWAGVFESSSGLATNSIGKVLIEPTATGVNSASAVFEVNSTTKGVLLPRMTTAQRDAIATPATGLEIYNTTTNRKEFYNGSYWRGDSCELYVTSTQASMTSGQTIYFGNLAQAPTTTAAIRKIYIRKAGVIRYAEIYSRAGTAGTAENWSFYVRLNNTTDYLIQTVGVSNQERIWTNSAMNIPVVAGDYIEIKAINPTWVTSPVNVAFGGVITIE